MLADKASPPARANSDLPQENADLGSINMTLFLGGERKL
jgi:hypothetical protein